jgi:5'-methylthioadenosine phosphorylase
VSSIHSYALIATATWVSNYLSFGSVILTAAPSDYDAWRVSEEPVTVAEVLATLHANSEASKIITETILAEAHEAISSGKVLNSAKGAMQYSIVTKRTLWPEEERRKLAFILPYFKQ